MLGRVWGRSKRGRRKEEDGRWIVHSVEMEDKGGGIMCIWVTNYVYRSGMQRMLQNSKSR